MKNKLLIIQIIIVIICICSFMISSCKTAEEKMAASGEEMTITQNETVSRITTISVEEVYEIIENNEDFLILDVRTLEEYDEGHILGVVLIPVDELEDTLNKLTKDKPIIVYCKAGIRSNIAANILINNGFTHVYDMSGGITEWIEKGYPVIGNIEAKAETESEEKSEVILVSVDDSYAYFSNDDYIFIDVRSSDEYESGHIEGAVNIPVSELEGRLDEIPKDKHIIVYCNGSGCNRSGNAAYVLIENGYTQVYDMTGEGIIEWEQKGYPME